MNSKISMNINNGTIKINIPFAQIHVLALHPM